MALIPRVINAGSNSTIHVTFNKPVNNEVLTAKLIRTKRLPGGKEEKIIHSEETVNVPHSE